jgi:hypothetical protein
MAKENLFPFALNELLAGTKLTGCERKSEVKVHSSGDIPAQSAGVAS